MKIDIPTKDMVKKMVDRKVRIEMNSIYKILNKFRDRLTELEEKIK